MAMFLRKKEWRRFIIRPSLSLILYTANGIFVFPTNFFAKISYNAEVLRGLLEDNFFPSDDRFL